MTSRGDGVICGYFGNELIAQENAYKCSRPYQAMRYCSLQYPPLPPSLPSNASSLLAAANVDVERHTKRLLKLQKTLEEEASGRQTVDEAKRLSLQLERQESASRSPVNDGEQGDNVAQMKALTGASEDKCSMLLKKCNNNLADACQNFFDEGERTAATIELLMPNGQTVREQIELSKTVRVVCANVYSWFKHVQVWDIKVLAYNELRGDGRAFRMFHENRQFLDSDYSRPIRSLDLDTSKTIRIQVVYNNT
eukprot:GHVS01034159.1.p1 GENE.GHVS01034159.1~~GHVS01034159.1.p1  ORF type:complete len:252 (+),score=31.17 GHVS01034159.1:50-805(+)